MNKLRSFFTHFNSEIKVFWWKYQMTSELLEETNHLIHWDDLSFELKMLPLDAFIAVLKGEIIRQTIYNKINIPFYIINRLPYVKKYQIKN